MVKIVGVGDIMPGGLLSDKSGECIKKDVSDILMQADIRVGTLECALGNQPTYDPDKVADRGNVIYAKDADLKRLKELHIDIVSLANNHFFDMGVQGALHTMERLDAEGIQHCGAGRDLAEASAPVVVEKNGVKVAFLAFCDTDYNHVFWCTYATETCPGVNPMTEEHVQNEIKKCVQEYECVVVLAHWGIENTFNPSVSSVRMARLMQKAGASLILGSHPHRIQPIINTSKGSIVYSMGNFLFPERLIAPPKVTYYPKDSIDYSMLPVTDEYPIVDCVTLKTLPYWSRVGLIVKSQIDDNGAFSNYHFSYLDKDNCLVLLDERKSQEAVKKIKCLTFLLKWRLYKSYMFVRKASISLKVRLKQLK